jgi:hypothetical protein
LAEFVSIVLSFPTVVFTVPLVMLVLYWLLVIVGAADLEIFEAGDGAMEGALDGALDGAVDGALDGAVDGAMDGAAEALDGGLDALDGAADGLEGAGDLLDGIEAEAAGAASGGVLVFLASALRLRRVPFTVSITLFVFWGWIAGFLLTALLGQQGVVPWLVFALGSMAAAMVAAAGLTNLSVRPLEPVFVTHQGRDHGSLIGETVEVTTGRVDQEFGQGECHVDNDALLLQLRCDTSANGLKRGDTALLVSFDRHRDAFVVEPMHAMNPAATAAAHRRSRVKEL